MNLLCLVNRNNPLSKDYKPSNIVEVPNTKIKVCKNVFDAFMKLNARLIKDNLSPLTLISGYRTYDYQERLFKKKVDYYKQLGLNSAQSEISAAKIVAVPGCSEHQLGLAIDVTSLELSKLDDPLISDFDRTREGEWLINNSYTEGFILRYPKNKKHLTQIEYEPWHYRYVGIEPATFMKHNNLCLEEYIMLIEGLQK